MKTRQWCRGNLGQLASNQQEDRKMITVKLIGVYSDATIARVRDIDRALTIQSRVLLARSKWPVGAVDCIIMQESKQ